MADITMCTNKPCPKANQCKRITAEPNKFFQSYHTFLFKEDATGVSCENYKEDLDVTVG